MDIKIRGVNASESLAAYSYLIYEEEVIVPCITPLLCNNDYYVLAAPVRLYSHTTVVHCCYSCNKSCTLKKTVKSVCRALGFFFEVCTIEEKSSFIYLGFKRLLNLNYSFCNYFYDYFRFTRVMSTEKKILYMTTNVFSLCELIGSKFGASALWRFDYISF